jgi:DNA-binding NarL/FixJ family response regulator
VTRLGKETSPGKPRLRVLLADGCAASGKRFREAMQRLPFVEIVGETRNSEETLALFFHLKPDVVVVSIILSNQDGLEVLRCIKQAVPLCSVILTSYGPQNFLTQAATLLGATALCCSDDGSAQLEDILHKLASRRAPDIGY